MKVFSIQQQGRTCFYIHDFAEIVKYIYLGTNSYEYHLIMTAEPEDILAEIDTNLQTNKRNPPFNRTSITVHVSNLDQKIWCDRYDLQSTMESVDFPPPFVPTITEQKNYILKDSASLYEYYSTSTFSIFRIEGFHQNWNILNLLPPTAYVFAQIACHMTKAVFDYEANALYTRNPSLNPKQIIFECPNLDALLWASEYGFSYIFANHNCYLDWNIFKPTGTTKKYDLVINSRPEKWKRPYLASKVSRFAFIKGASYRGPDEQFNYKKFPYSYINSKPLTPVAVNEIYNQSYCGGIFSELEGACYSSSEYLLAGLPVVSTESKGGRDVWYTETNSIIVEPTEDAVRTAVQQAKEKLASGFFQPMEIRNAHISKSEECRTNFITKVQAIADAHGIAFNSREYFHMKYFHKFIKYVPYSVAKSILDKYHPH